MEQVWGGPAIAELRDLAGCEDSEFAKSMLEQARGVHGIPRRYTPIGHLDDLPTCRPVDGRQRGRVQDVEVQPGLPRQIRFAGRRSRAFEETFSGHYNDEYRHSGIGLHTPASVHFGTVSEVRAQRQQTLNAVYGLFTVECGS